MRDALSKDQLKQVYGNLAGRYDFQHALITASTDQKGRKLLVERAVTPGDSVLDTGSGTGSTGILAARKVGVNGKVMMFDLSDAMLAVAKNKVAQEGLQERISYQTGDMVHMPFENDSFDVVLSSYSLCPLYDPTKGALELYRVTRPGGKIAVAHSVEPKNPLVKWLSDRIEDLAWKLPWLSMGCRSVDVLPALLQTGCKVLFYKNIGVPLWPFFVFIVEKPIT